MKYTKVCPLCLNFRYITAKLFGIQKFRNFTVLLMSLIEPCYESTCLLPGVIISLSTYELPHEKTGLYSHRIIIWKAQGVPQ